MKLWQTVELLERIQLRRLFCRRTADAFRRFAMRNRHVWSTAQARAYAYDRAERRLGKKYNRVLRAYIEEER